MAGDLIARAEDAFRADASIAPPLTLRGGDAVDGYERAPAFDPEIDRPTDDYLEQFAFWGLGYLDAQSWRHYLPRLIAYALQHADDPRMVTEAFVRSLRPPDRYPPRLASLTPAQDSIVREFLEQLAAETPSSGLREDARQALQEWWLPSAIARPTPEEIAARRAAPTSYRTTGSDICRLAVPETLSGSGLRDIPEESRRVETWGGYICDDVHVVIAVNVTPLSVRSLAESVRWRTSLLRDPVPSRRVHVRGARRAKRLDGLTSGDSPAEPQRLTMVFAEAGDELATVAIRTWEREDVRQVVERVIESLHLVPRGPER